MTEIVDREELALLVERSGGTLRGIHVDGVDLSEVSWRGLRVTGCRFTHVRLARADLSFGEWSDVELSDVDCEGALFTGCTWRGVRVERAVFSTADLRSAELREVTLEQVHLHRVSLRAALVEGLRAVMCDLRESDWSGARFDDCVFTDVVLERSRWVGAGFSSVSAF